MGLNEHALAKRQRSQRTKEEIKAIAEELQDRQAELTDQIEAAEAKREKLADQELGLAEEYKTVTGQTCDCEFLGFDCKGHG